MSQTAPAEAVAADPRGFLQSLFAAAVTAASAAVLVPGHLPPPPAGRTVVVGAGKAAAAMAAAVAGHWPGPLGGLVVTRYGYGRPAGPIEVVEAGHPQPDAAGEAAARRLLGELAGLSEDDLVLCLISGGGSALLSLPAAGITLADKQAVNEMLLRSGATIAEINCVRKHLSAIKGGQLALAAWPARIVTLIISDVPGDDVATVASGPSVADPTTYADALAVIAKYRLKPPAAVLAHLQAGAAGGSGAPAETPKPGDVRLSRGEVIILATAADALAAAAAAARASDVDVRVLGAAIEGEARVVGREHGELALSLAAAPRSPAPLASARSRLAESRREDFGAPSRLAGAAALPLVLLSGGETTVTVRGHGRGGPNSEYLLSLALTLAGKKGIYALAADSDGTDGSEDNAGAFIGPDTLARAAARGLDPAALLADNDAYTFFAGLDDLFISGPTQTNVNDVRALLILPSDG